MRRRGIVLVSVLVVTALAAMVAASFLYRIRAEVAASAASGSGEQAHWAAMCGLQRAMAVLEENMDDPAVWTDAPDLFQNQLIWDEGGNRWYFTVYAPSGEDPAVPRYGVTDEAGKANLNLATPEAIGNLLAGITTAGDQDVEALAEALVAYRQGKQLTTVEEVLLVPGFRGPVVYGEDVNLNGLLDANEDDGDDTFPPDNRDQALERGLAAVATTMSYEWDVDRAGNPRVNMNDDPDGVAQVEGLSRETAQFIRDYRSAGGRFTHPSQLLGLEIAAGGGNRGRGRSRGPGQATRSPLTDEELPVVLDKLTAVSAGGRATALLGLINVNTAPARVLATVPGIDADLAEQIVARRAELYADTRATTAWVYTTGLVDADAFKAIAPRLTARGRQFRVRCVGFGVPSGRYTVLEAVIDLAGGRARIAYLRDLTRMGMPFELDAELQEEGL